MRKKSRMERFVTGGDAFDKRSQIVTSRMQMCNAISANDIHIWIKMSPNCFFNVSSFRIVVFSERDTSFLILCNVSIMNKSSEISNRSFGTGKFKTRVVRYIAYQEILVHIYFFLIFTNNLTKILHVKKTVSHFAFDALYFCMTIREQYILVAPRN